MHLPLIWVAMLEAVAGLILLKVLAEELLLLKALDEVLLLLLVAVVRFYCPVEWVENLAGMVAHCSQWVYLIWLSSLHQHIAEK